MTEDALNNALSEQRRHFQTRIEAQERRWLLALRYLDRFDIARIEAAMRETAREAPKGIAAVMDRNGQ